MQSLYPDLLNYGQIAPVILRAVLGAIFLGHGYSKLVKSRLQTAEFFASVGLKPGKFWALFIGTVETGSAIMLFLGLFTQLAAALIVCVMIGAIIFVKRKQGFLSGYDFDLLILACALSLLVLGPGIFSLDLPL
jgi:putative oxidoreductase